ncbi:hypothetical protein JL720_7806 [Aureococcus anophagefferens]|nr:hypothetical protein JL720_7806 [Aureococcus anophagefferens]
MDLDGVVDCVELLPQRGGANTRKPPAASRGRGSASRRRASSGGGGKPKGSKAAAMARMRDEAPRGARRDAKASGRKKQPVAVAPPRANDGQGTATPATTLPPGAAPVYDALINYPRAKARGARHCVMCGRVPGDPRPRRRLPARRARRGAGAAPPAAPAAPATPAPPRRPRPRRRRRRPRRSRRRRRAAAPATPAPVPMAVAAAPAARRPAARPRPSPPRPPRPRRRRDAPRRARGRRRRRAARDARRARRARGRAAPAAPAASRRRRRASAAPSSQAEQDVRRECDKATWKHAATGCYFKWCKGKRFRNLAAFAGKLAASKCDTRARGRGAHAAQDASGELIAEPRAARRAGAAPPPPAPARRPPPRRGRPRRRRRRSRASSPRPRRRASSPRPRRRGPRPPRPRRRARTSPWRGAARAQRAAAKREEKDLASLQEGDGDFRMKADRVAMLQRFVAIFQYKGADPPDQLFPFPVVPEGAVDEAYIVALPTVVEDG